MGAITLWVRSRTRQRIVATLLLGLVAGLSAATVATAVSGAQRARTSLARHLALARPFQLGITVCAPGSNPEAFTSNDDYLKSCANREALAEFRNIVRAIPGIRDSTVLSSLSVGIVGPRDDAKPHVVLGFATESAGAPMVFGRPILIAGRLARPTAANEIVVGEASARVSRIRVGDNVTVVGPPQRQIDEFTGGHVPFSSPDVSRIPSKVVGIVRSVNDVSNPQSAGDSSGFLLPGFIHLGPAWAGAHADGLARYHTGLMLSLDDPSPAGVARFADQLKERSGSFVVQGPFPVSGPNDAETHTIRTERTATLVFALLAAIVSAGFIGLLTLRQLRQELAERDTLEAIGFTRRELIAATMLRALTVAVIAGVVATGTAIAATRTTPFGLAGKLEFTHPLRFEPRLLGLAWIGLVLVLGTAALLASRKPRSRHQPMSVRKLSALLANAGPRLRISVAVARGPAARTIVGAALLAVAGVVAAGSITAAHQRTLAEPSRYGTWWDYALGDYASPTSYEAAVARVRANRSIETAVGYAGDTFSIGGTPVTTFATLAVVGRHDPVMVTGRAPSSVGEIALGRDTARRLHRDVGSTVKVNVEGQALSTARVTGIVRISNPMATATEVAGTGAFITREYAVKLGRAVPLGQTIAVRFRPSVSRSAAYASVLRDFPALILGPNPASDVRDLRGLRPVAWLLALLVALLSFAVILSAIAILSEQHRRDSKTLRALGMVRGQRRSVLVFATGFACLLGASVGVIPGLVVGRRLWRVIADSVSVANDSPLHLPTLIGGPVAALAVVALCASILGLRLVSRVDLGGPVE